MKVTPQNLSEVTTLLMGHSVLGVDTETTGLGHEDLPFAVIVATDTEEYYFDERLIPGLWGMNELRFILGNPETVYVFQNAKFDMTMLSRRNLLVMGTVCDDAVMARLLRNDHWHPKAYSLDGQAQRELGKAKDNRVKKYIDEHNLYEVRRDYFGEETKVPRFDWVPVELMCEYACTDARLTYDLYKHYLAKLDDKSKEVLATEMALTKVCWKMERTGLLLDVQYTLSTMYAEQQKASELKEQLTTLTGKEYKDSAKHWEAWFKECNVTLPRAINPKTGMPTENPSLNDDVLESIIALSKLDYVRTPHITASKAAELMQSIRHYEKRVSTYYKNYLNMQDKEHVIHPSMWQAGTRTGRFSYSDPNLQNIPKKEAGGDAPIRGCFRPRLGKVFVSMDYKQQEYRMMLAYAGETKVIKEVAAGKDVHQSIADVVGIDRDPAKTLNFATLYGAGPPKIAKMLKIPVKAAERMKNGYFMALPNVEKFIDAVIGVGRSRGYVINWAGRRLYAEKEFCYALPNHLIQSGCADVIKRAMVEIDRQFPEIPMVVQIHDQLVFEMEESQLHLIPSIAKIMANVWSMNGITLEVDVATSRVSLAEKDMVKYAG